MTQHPLPEELLERIVREQNRTDKLLRDAWPPADETGWQALRNMLVVFVVGVLVTVGLLLLAAWRAA